MSEFFSHERAKAKIVDIKSQNGLIVFQSNFIKCIIILFCFATFLVFSA